MFFFFFGDNINMLFNFIAFIPLPNNDDNVVSWSYYISKENISLSFSFSFSFSHLLS